MKLYTETTDGSTIEDKETAVVWCYEDADPDFGSCQAKELLDHLESVLANEPVSVKSGSNCVEVKPQVNADVPSNTLAECMFCFQKLLASGIDKLFQNACSRDDNILTIECVQGVSKGLVARRLLSTMKERELLPDFVLCIGDDRSDEDMFEVITTATSGPSLAPDAEVFACTVCRKPSKAKYYLDDTTEIVRLMQGLANVSDQAPPISSNPA